MSDAGGGHVAWLRSRWSTVFAGLPSVGDRLIEAYTEPTRSYHDTRHLFEVLQHVDELAGGCPDRTSVELAAWFHDAVYDVRRGDNEEASAALARALLLPHLPAEQVDEVERLILLTRDHAVSAGDIGGAILVDADLAVLASDPADYADYVARVRQEYGHLADPVFRRGRAVVLRDLLALPRLFHTPFGATNWEAPARANLQRELELP